MRQLLVLTAFALAAAGCASQTRVAATTTEARPVDPYSASVAYVRCMRAHGIALPDPKANGDIQLTPPDERRIGRPGPKNDAADRSCFRFLRGSTSTQPISARGRRRMANIMKGLARCMSNQGYEFNEPVVKNLSRGRVSMLFPDMPAKTMAESGTPRYKRAQRQCERGIPAKLDAVIADERGVVLPY